MTDVREPDILQTVASRKPPASAPRQFAEVVADLDAALTLLLETDTTFPAVSRSDASP
jgi:hypothetical protein